MPLSRSDSTSIGLSILFNVLWSVRILECEAFRYSYNSSMAHTKTSHSYHVVILAHFGVVEGQEQQPVVLSNHQSGRCSNSHTVNGSKESFSTVNFLSLHSRVRRGGDTKVSWSVVTASAWLSVRVSRCDGLPTSRLMVRGEKIFVKKGICLHKTLHRPRNEPSSVSWIPRQILQMKSIT